jgi:hypothetical protein
VATGQIAEGDAMPVVTEPILWQEPADIGSRNLRFGPGSPALAPAPPFKFLREDKSGESPKFDVLDSKGTEWSVKLGPEAQAETVATRLVWAVGYFAEEAYYLPSVRMRGLPKLSRGQEYVRGVFVLGARFEPRRRNVERGETWDWQDNPFTGTRELNGLKVMMVLLNNYDARTDNNRVLRVRDPQIGHVELRYVVTDLGATLGRVGGYGEKRSKNNLADYRSTEFVTGVKDNEVKFDYDTRPTRYGVVTVLYPPYYLGEVKKEKSMKGVPAEDAKWIGSLLMQLSDEQLRQAFRAAGYDRGTMEGYVRTLRERIVQLTRL